MGMFIIYVFYDEGRGIYDMGFYENSCIIWGAYLEGISLKHCTALIKIDEELHVFLDVP